MPLINCTCTEMPLKVHRRPLFSVYLQGGFLDWLKQSFPKLFITIIYILILTFFKTRLSIFENINVHSIGFFLSMMSFIIYKIPPFTLRGLNFGDHSIRKILTLSRGFNFADGPFPNILRISRMGLVQIFSQISQIDKAVLETQKVEKRKEKRTNYETSMIFTFEKIAKAYVLRRIKTV